MDDSDTDVKGNKVRSSYFAFDEGEQIWRVNQS